MRRIARWLRALADRLDPPALTVVDRLYPRAMALVRSLEGKVRAGSIKELLAMKALERETGQSRLDIKDAINRAVRVLRAERAAGGD